MMNSISDSTPPASGQFVRVDVTLRSSGLWLGPVWAVLCGIIASGRFSWDARGALLAGLTLFLVDGLWATCWTNVVETNWGAIAARWNTSPPPLRPRTLPYMRLGAPGDRATRWLSQLAYWWQTDSQPLVSTTFSSIVICVALGAGLAAVLGWPVLALSAAALAIVQIGIVINRATGQPVPAVESVLEIGLAWLVGHAAFGAISLSSALLAALFTLTFVGGRQLAEQDTGLPNWRWPQLIAALVLLLTHNPLPALVLFFVLFAQMLLEPGLKQGRGGAWFVRSSQAWLIAAMLISAFTIS